jgi:hypothetical protein
MLATFQARTDYLRITAVKKTTAGLCRIDQPHIADERVKKADANVNPA